MIEVRGRGRKYNCHVYFTFGWEEGLYRGLVSPSVLVSFPFVIPFRVTPLVCGGDFGRRNCPDVSTDSKSMEREQSGAIKAGRVPNIE